MCVLFTEHCHIIWWILQHVSEFRLSYLNYAKINKEIKKIWNCTSRVQVKLTQNLTPIICCQLITSVLVSKATHLRWDLSCNSLLAVIQTSYHESRVKSVRFLWGSRDFYHFCINSQGLYDSISPGALPHLIHLPLKGELILPAGAFGGVHAQPWVMKY